MRSCSDGKLQMNIDKLDCYTDCMALTALTTLCANLLHLLAPMGSISNSSNDLRNHDAAHATKKKIRNWEISGSSTRRELRPAGNFDN